MATLLFGRDAKTEYILGEELKSGGEGIVYSIISKQNSVAKVYKQERISDPQLRETTKNKILAMIDMQYNPYLNGRISVAWPEDALFDSSGFFLGFVMPRIENMKSLIWASRPTDRTILWPNGYRWHYSVAIAFNLALTIEHIHKADIVVGDMNTNNILINANGNVALIDSDSFNITSKTGEVFKCIVGFPEVLPAELQGKDLTKPTNQFSKQTDAFSLAVHIFTLLCNNCHPFGCLNYSTVHGSSSNPQIIDNIVKGYCPYVNDSADKTVDDALDMGVFPDEIRELFTRAFYYNSSTSIKQETIKNRPSALEWRIALGNLYNQGVVTCSNNPLHEYPKTYHKGCPWCAIDKRKQSTSMPCATISVLHCDNNGNTLRTESFDIQFGKSRTVYAASIPGYHATDERQAIDVYVDGTGKPSENPIRFIYAKDKKRSKIGFAIAAVIILLLIVPFRDDNTSSP